jgi:ferrous iron transport protein A
MIQKIKRSYSGGVDMQTLGNLKPGQSCKIKKIHVSGAALQRLVTMGFLPGTVIKIIRNAPLLDPFDILVNKTLVAVRKAEANGIEVEVL